MSFLIKEIERYRFIRARINIKVVPVGAALNENLVTGSDLIDCSVSTYRNGSRDLRLPNDHHPLGKISVHEVVQKSSNRGAAQLGIKLGAKRLYDYCRLFGFGQRTIFEWEEKDRAPCIIRLNGMV